MSSNLMSTNCFFLDLSPGSLHQVNIEAGRHIEACMSMMSGLLPLLGGGSFDNGPTGHTPAKNGAKGGFHCFPSCHPILLFCSKYIQTHSNSISFLLLFITIPKATPGTTTTTATWTSCTRCTPPLFAWWSRPAALRAVRLFFPLVTHYRRPIYSTTDGVHFSLFWVHLFPQQF